MRTATSSLEVRVEHVGQHVLVVLVARVDVDVEQLWEIKVDMTLRKREQSIAQIGLHAGLFAIEQVSYGYGHVKVFGFKET